MNFDIDYYLKDKHATLPPSQAARWANKDLEFIDIQKMIISEYAQQIGTLLHQYAEEHISYHTKINKSDKKEVRLFLLKNNIPENVMIDYLDRTFDNLMTYTNDAIGFKMSAEVPLWYSCVPLQEFKRRGLKPPVFGTADAIAFRNDILRIHDLKTGVRPTHMEQLAAYASLFCLKEKIKPGEIQIKLAIYQSNEVFMAEPTAEDILPIMDRIIRYDKWLTSYLFEEES